MDSFQNAYRPGLQSLVSPTGEAKTYPDGEILLLRNVQLRDTSEAAMRIKVRRTARVEVKGTIYGRSHRVRLTQKEHSPSGLNVALINAEGVPDFEKIHNLVRHSVTNDLARAARVNDIAIRFVAENTYENYTSLLFNLCALSWVAERHQKASRHILNIKISNECLPSELTPVDRREEVYWALVDRICTGNCGYKRVPFTYPIGNWEEAISHGKEDGNKSKIFNIKCWRVDDYSDGHTVIDSKRFVEFGFKHRHFLVNEGFRDYDFDNQNAYGRKQGYYDDDVATAEMVFKRKFLVRAEGMTSRDMGIIMLAIYCRKRYTPFLCDQDNILATGADKITWIGEESSAVRSRLDQFANSGRLRFSSADVRSAMHKFIALHRCYDDAMNGFRLFDNFVAQPLPTTVEGHLWSNHEWTTDLPVLGMRRAGLAMMVSETAALITPDALDIASKMVNRMSVQQGVGLMVNYLWFWGEYFYVAQQAQHDEMVSSMVGGKFKEMDPKIWQAGILSAMVGQRQPVSPFTHVGTRMTYSNDSNFNNRDLLVNQDSGGRELSILSETRVNEGEIFLRFKVFVPPSSPAAIMGCAGPLLRGTPYDPVLQINAAATQRLATGMYKETDWMNLWKCGVIQRWNGWDLRYCEGNNVDRDRCAVMFASNEDMIALPPVIDGDAAILRPYVIFRSDERNHNYGEHIFDKMQDGSTRSMVWNLGAATMKEHGVRRSEDATLYTGGGSRINMVYERVILDRQYTVMVMADYDKESGDFRYELTRTGEVPVQQAIAAQAEVEEVGVQQALAAELSQQEMEE